MVGTSVLTMSGIVTSTYYNDFVWLKSKSIIRESYDRFVSNNLTVLYFKYNEIVFSDRIESGSSIFHIIFSIPDWIEQSALILLLYKYYMILSGFICFLY